MIAFPNAKINIGLNILRKRADGFHDIESLFYPIKLCDVLEIVKSEEFEFTTSGIEIPGDSTSNLCVKAFQLIQQSYKIGNAKIHLRKVIPMGAGLGGGSADAAFCINMLNSLFELDIPLQRRLDYATQLGSDCTFFIENKAAIATGRGEVLTPFQLDLSGKWIGLVNPNIYVGTAEAYQGAIIDEQKQDLKNTLSETVDNWKGNVINAFEQSVFLKHPQLDEVKNKLYDMGAEYASMTGSGSTVFGIFANEPRFEFDSFFTWKLKI
ncbi:MAG: 4-(cytidine 5'-diphospho)-2-C-methyl-D-erythritol kinase [Flavobacteriales bacterium]|nr:4-(cytidine 5'-diphospho)-2-C-methyl-D-erythritol kinase [Flavobacteriales bacterium]